jgi:autotransporter-associated beta strand protein
VLTFPGLGGNAQQITASLLPPASANGVWIADADGNWSDADNWSGGIIAAGGGYTADFSTVSLTADHTITLDASRSIGTLRFGDSSGGRNWVLASTGAAALTLDSGSTTPPSVVVNQNTATLQAPLAGANGFTKSGPGTLVLSAANSLSGILFTDTGSGSANDGAVCIAASAALAGVTFISTRNNSAATAASTLQLDGSAANVLLPQTITNSCRANTIPNVQNLAGSNILSGSFYMQTGGSNVVFESDAGTLVLAGPLRYIGTLTSGRSFNFFGVGDTLVTAPVLFSSVAPVSVGKFGSGTLTLAGTNTYAGGTTIAGGALVINGSLGAGPVTVSGGTLGGAGTIAGPVNVLAGGTVSAGNGLIGSLTINNSLTNVGTLSMKLSKSGSSRTNDTIQGLTQLTYGGTLKLSMSGDPVTVGDSFKLFYATNYTGRFSAIIPPTPGPGLLWSTNDLGTSGSLSVVLGSVAPRVTQVSWTGSSLIFRGSDAAAGYSYSVLSSTNLALPVTNWAVLIAGTCDSYGNFIFTNVPAAPQQFFILRQP